MEKEFKNPISERAQTAMELAIFGAVLIFVLGIMIRSAVNYNYTQNQQLKAMRMAFKESFASSTSSFDRDTGDSSRATASLLFIEDRTTPDVNKYGSLTRTPYVVSASGTFSRTLFKSLDWQDVQSIPLYDMYINGQHFTFTLGAFVDYNISQTDSIPGVEFVPLPPSGPVGDRDWDPNCGTLGAGSGGCRRLYVIVPNSDPNFCSGDPCCTSCSSGDCDTARAPCMTACIPLGLRRPSCEATCQANYEACLRSLPSSDLTAAQRFDLNRNGISDRCDGCPTPADVPPSQWRDYAWQWKAIKANSVDINVETGKNVNVDVDGDLKEEQILEMFDNQGRQYRPEDATNGNSKANIKAPIVRVRVLDSQRGDLDLTYNGPTANQPGLKENMSMYTYTRDGTYLLIQEGRLYNPESRATVRSIQKRDQVDIIERAVQLSNNTGRFCRGGVPSPENPGVEACNDCFTAEHINKTCFDGPSLILYVRSRLADRRGHKWITEIE